MHVSSGVDACHEPLFNVARTSVGIILSAANRLELHSVEMTLGSTPALSKSFVAISGSDEDERSDENRSDSIEYISRSSACWALKPAGSSALCLPRMMRAHLAAPACTLADCWAEAVVLRARSSASLPSSVPERTTVLVL